MKLPARTSSFLAALMKVLLTICAMVTLAGASAEYTAYKVKGGFYSWYTEMFSLSHEANFPTWYSATLLLICALLLAANALLTKLGPGSLRRHWWVLGFIFLYMSIDEASTIHEHLHRVVDTSSRILYFDWVIPASCILLALGIYFLPFLRRLPRRTRNRFIVAGCVYVGGALLMELPLGWWTHEYGSHNLTYGMIDLVEESMEILGLSLFLVALAERLAHTLHDCGIADRVSLASHGVPAPAYRDEAEDVSESSVQ